MTSTSHIMNLPRYFVITDADLAAYKANPSVYEYHYMDLGSIGTAGAGYHLVVMRGARLWTAPGTWQEMPHILDPTTTLVASVAKLLGDMGVKASHTMFQASMAMANFNRMFDP